MRVLHGPVNVGNEPWVLSRHERQLGADSDVVVNYSTWLGYRADRCLGAYGQRSWRQTARKLLFGLSYPFRYDVLHYYFGQSFFGRDDPSKLIARLAYADVKLARRLGKPIFMTLQGCDVRQSDVSSARNTYTPCHLGQCQAAATCRATLDERRRAFVRDVLPLADRTFVLNPELARFVPDATFLPYASVDVEAVRPSWPKTHGVPLILHAPSDEHIKGTAFIVKAIEELQRRQPLEFVMVKGLPHHEAMKLYERADLVIDQVLTGWYGGFAVEAMAMGKPVACYLRDEDLDCLPAGMREELPLVRVTPATLVADLEAALAQRQLWPEWGRQARDFVLRWHHPRRLAAAMLRAYRDPTAPIDLSCPRSPAALASMACQAARS